MTRKRDLYDKMKLRGISTLQLKRVLSEIDIEVPQRTLQYWLDSDMVKCTDERIKTVANQMVRSYDSTITKLKIAL